MPWVKLDDGFYSNPKVIKAPPLARSLYVAGLCHCASGLTDGQITKAALALLVAQTGAPPRTAAAALVKVGLWHDHGDHYTVNDWSHFNRTAADISEQREAERKKKAAQRAAAAKKALKGEDGQFVSQGDKEGDTPGDTEGDRGPAGTRNGKNQGNSKAIPTRNGSDSDSASEHVDNAVTSTDGEMSRRDSPRESPATRPDPTYLSTSSNNSKGVGDPASNPEEGQPRTPEARAQAAIEHMARCDLKASQAAGEIIKFPDAWLRTAIERRHGIHHGRLLADATERPDASPVDLAEDIDPACGPDDGGLARALASAAKTEQLVADQHQHRADRERAKRILGTIGVDDLNRLEQLADQHLAQLGLGPEDPTHRITRKATLEALALEHHGTAAP